MRRRRSPNRSICTGLEICSAFEERLGLGTRLNLFLGRLAFLIYKGILLVCGEVGEFDVHFELFDFDCVD
jgi:hypothetical protein